MKNKRYYLYGDFEQYLMQSEYEWNEAKLVEHCKKHVWDGDAIEKETFIDIHNKIEPSNIIDNTIFSKLEDSEIINKLNNYYKNISLGTIDSALVGYQSNDVINNKEKRKIIKKRIVFAGSFEYYRYSTITDFSNKSIYSSYPSYISDRFWLFPNIYKRFFHDVNIIKTKKIKFIDENDLEPPFKIELERLIEYSELVLKKDDRINDLERVKGSLLAYSCTKDMHKRFKQMYSDLFSKIEESCPNHKNELVEHPKEYALNVLNSGLKNNDYDIYVLKFNQEQYSERILSYFITDNYSNMINESCLSNDELCLNNNYLYSDYLEIEENKYIIEIPILLTWIKERLKKIHRFISYYDDNLFTNFNIVDSMYLTYMAIKIVQEFEAKFAGKQYLNLSDYLYYFKNDLKVFNNKCKDSSNSINIWQKIYKNILDIDLNNI